MLESTCPSSCEQGICGSCETRVLGGEPDHRNSILTDEERAANKPYSSPAGEELCQNARRVLTPQPM